jgi:hypothetical protein
MMDCRGNLKLPGDTYPKQRQVYTLLHEELEIESMSASFSNTSSKLQDISVVLDYNTILPESKKCAQISDVSMDSMVATMRDKGCIDAANLANNWGIGIDAANKTFLVTTQRGIAWTIHPSFTKRFKTNDRQMRYHRMPITMYTDTMYATIVSRTGCNAAHVF